jgi:cholesterol transport system auxiliary component
MTDLLLSRRRALRAAASLVPLTGCSLLFPQSPPQLYRLTPRTDDAPTAPLVRGQLVIGAPMAPQSFDTERIALTRNRSTLDYFAGAAWTDRVPVLLQALLVEAFENSGRIVAVSRDSSDLTPDDLLVTELRAFEARYTDATEQPPTVVVRMVVKLVKMPDHQIVNSMLAAEQAATAHNDLVSVVDAFDVAVGRVLTRIVDWTLSLMARA